MNIIKKPLNAVLKRNFYTRGLFVDVVPTMMRVTREHDTTKLETFAKICTFVIIPITSAHLWWDFYQNNFVHRTRMPWPSVEYMNNITKPYPWGDGERSALFHPYFNFTHKGYVTDPEGNPLPPGVYSPV